MSYYYVFLNTCADFDDDTVFYRQPNQPLVVENIGLIFDWWPIDDLFESSMEIFCTERLKSLLETDYQKFTGIQEFEEIKRIAIGSNWVDRHFNARPGNYWRVKISGQAFSDDFGFFQTSIKWLVVSERALRFLLRNHVTEVLGKKIDGDSEIFFKNYETLYKETNYSHLPPKLLDIESLF